MVTPTYGHHIKVKMGEWDMALTQIWIDDTELYVTKFEIVEEMGGGFSIGAATRFGSLLVIRPSSANRIVVETTK